MMKSMTVTTALCIALTAGCTPRDERVAFDGVFFNAKARKVEKQNDVFTVTVKKVSQSLDGAREAGRHAGTEYCIEKFGTSRIQWGIGPDTPPEQLQIVGDSITFDGKCPQT